MGRDLQEAERVKRLLPARVGIVAAPSLARGALKGVDVLLLEDRHWPHAEEEALEELRELSGSRKLALILSRRRGEKGERALVPVVERPYRMEEIVSAMKVALLRNGRSR